MTGLNWDIRVFLRKDKINKQKNTSDELCHERTGFLPLRKLRRRSALQ